jgi:hypothetical protein
MRSRAQANGGAFAILARNHSHLRKLRVVTAEHASPKQCRAPSLPPSRPLKPRDVRGFVVAMQGGRCKQRKLKEWNWLAPCRVDLRYWEVATMSVQDEDYRTNRADYVIAADGRAIRDGDRDEHQARKKKSLWLRDRRSAKLAANPSDSSPEAKSRPRV